MFEVNEIPEATDGAFAQWNPIHIIDIKVQIKFVISVKSINTAI